MTCFSCVVRLLPIRYLWKDAFNLQVTLTVFTVAKASGRTRSPLSKQFLASGIYRSEHGASQEPSEYDRDSRVIVEPAKCDVGHTSTCERGKLQGVVMWVAGLSHGVAAIARAQDAAEV